MNSNKKMLTTIAIMGILAVSIGAFGAHGLKPRLSAENLTIYHTGVSYHFYHLLSMAFAYVVFIIHGSKYSKIGFWLFFAGIILFSGSLYLLSSRELLGLTSYKWLGPLTPIGGLCFIAAWVSILISAGKGKEEKA